MDTSIEDSVAPQKRVNIFGRIAWLMLARVVAAGLQALIMIIIARKAGPTDFGVMSAFLGLCVLFQAIFDMGLSTYLTRLRAATPNAPRVYWTLRVYLVIGLLLFVSLTTLAAFTGISTGHAWWYLVPLAAVAFLERQADMRVVIALADGDIWKNFIVLVIRRIITLAVLLYAINLNADVVFGFGLAALVGAGASVAISMSIIKHKVPRQKVRIADARKLLFEARGFWANSIGGQLRNLDIVLVSSLATATTAGYYSAIAKTTNPLLMLSASLAAVILPVVSGDRSDRFQLVRRPIMVVLCIMALIYVILAIFADELIPWLLGEDYTPAVRGFQLVMLALIFAGICSILNSILQAQGYEGMVGRISLASACLCLVLISAGSLFWGVTGAAAGLGASYVVQAFILVVSSLPLRANSLRSSSSVGN